MNLIKRVIPLQVKWLFAILLGFSVPYQAASAKTDYEDCVIRMVNTSNINTKVKEIKLQCKKLMQAEKTPVKEPVSVSEPHNEKPAISIATRKPFTILAHKPNYILPVSYNKSGYDASLYQAQFANPGLTLDKQEAQFQISVKVPLATNLFNKNISVYSAYTNRSFWQLYNDSISSPFRETNHEPEIWLETNNNMNIAGFKNTSNRLGFVHQSNGRGGILSRSWNRIYADLRFEKESWAIGFKAWARIKENIADDDNRDITDYLGHSELNLAYKYKKHTFSLMSRNNIESGFDRGAVELGWSFPLGSSRDLKGYVQIFSGYGESLIDYNRSVNRIGIGVVLADWL